MKFDKNIPWPLLQEHLTSSLKQIAGELDAASDMYEIYRLQGESRRLKKLLNLPGTLEVLYSKEES